MPVTTTKLMDQLYARGVARVQHFVHINKLPEPVIASVPTNVWSFDCCAYYRPVLGIRICLGMCAKPATAAPTRNWNWPGSTTDRTPYGVLCHELGHHVDYRVSQRKYTYSGSFGESIRLKSGEQPLTSYCPDDGEWFAEMFRLFVTNPALLYCVRPKTWQLLSNRFRLSTEEGWRHELGSDVPSRIVKSLKNKGAA